MALDRLMGMTVFRRAVEGGSIAAAGRATGVTAEMAGQHLKALEVRLGVRLLSRTTRRLTPTDAGKAYYERCVAALEEIALADAEAGARQAEPSGRLRLTAPMGFGNLLLAPVIAAFLDRHPNLAVEITLSEHRADLLAGDYDLAIRLGDLASSSLIARRLAGFPLILVASPAYVAKKGGIRHPSELVRHEALIYEQTATPTAWRFQALDGAQVSVAIRGRVVASDIEFLVRLALLDRGLLLAPSFMIDVHLKTGALIDVMPDWRERSLPLHVLWPHRTLTPVPTRAFVDFMVDWFSEKRVSARSSP